MTETAAATNFDFIIDAEERKALTVNLVGKSYDIYPPKASLTLMMASKSSALMDKNGKVSKSNTMSPDKVQAYSSLIDGWVRATFTKEGHEDVMARLNDPADRLDMQHVFQLVEALVERNSVDERPTS